ncbi:MAG: hypothetical protein HYZ27_04015, partial [Deltaproteobacteria bacterium]|nr:hypothetical protein [Deltaproteobacteria bacterium]
MTRGFLSHRRRGLVLAGSMVASASIAGCGPITPFIREHCDEEARRVGSPAEDADIKLVQRLLLALSTDDFAGFQTLQPTQSQYLAYAWRHGPAHADALVEVIQEPDSARRDFGALVARLRGAGIEARSAERCTRRLAWDPQALDRYDLVVVFDKERLTVPIYASSERLSVAGRPDLDRSAARLFLFKTLAIATDLVERMERAASRDGALAQAEGFAKAHAADLPKLDAEAVPLAELMTEPRTAELVAQAMRVLSARWQAVVDRFPGVEGDARFQAAMTPFRLLGEKLATKASAGPAALPPTCTRYL